MTNLLNNVKITRVSADGAGAASATPTKATILDMDGWESVMFIASLGNVLDTSAVSLRAAGADTNSTGAMALYAGGPGGTAGASDYDDKLLVLDVVRPPHRYIEAQIFHVTANGPFDGIIAIQYNGRLVPSTQGSTVIDSETIAPAVLA